MVSGISGDMTLAALLQIENRAEELSEIFSDIFKISIKIDLKEKSVNGIRAFQLKIDAPKENSIHRNYKTIRECIEKSDLDDKVKKDSLQIFHLIAEVESKIHNVCIDDIHFHEIGALDSIIDIVGVSYLINKINPHSIYSSPAKCGHGVAKTAHGLIPIPVPATMEILKDFPFERLNIESELTTPTGAAIIKHFVKSVNYNFRGVVQDIFYSTGTKLLKLHQKSTNTNLNNIYPNLLRVIKFKESPDYETIFMIETNLDDISSEHLGGLFEILFKNGALDVYFTPIYMKKNRPAYKLSVITKKENKDLIIFSILKHTTTGGVRFYPLSRYELDKSFIEVEFKGLPFKIKVLEGGGIKKFAPEWEDIRRNSEKLSLPTHQLYIEVMKTIAE